MACNQTELDVVRSTGFGLTAEPEASEASKPAEASSLATATTAPGPSTARSVAAQPSGPETAPTPSTPGPSDASVEGDAGLPSPPSATASAMPDSGAAACAVVGGVTSYEVYRLHLRSNGGCMQATKQTVPQLGPLQPGSVLRLASPCVEDVSTQFRLTPILTGDFKITSELIQVPSVPPPVVDVLMGESFEGTPVILYANYELLNQRFTFVPRDAGFYAMVPSHAKHLCVTYDPEADAQGGSTLVVRSCVFGEQLQEWQLLPMGCSLATDP